jgi:hypothetical protein
MSSTISSRPKEIISLYHSLYATMLLILFHIRFGHPNIDQLAGGGAVVVLQ